MSKTKYLMAVLAMVVGASGFAAAPAGAATSARITGSVRCGAGSYPARLNLWVPDNGSVTMGWGAGGYPPYSRNVTVYRGGQNYVNWDLTCAGGWRGTGQFFFSASGTTTRNICRSGVYCG